MNEDRKDYLRYLGQMRDRAREAALRPARRAGVGAPRSAGAVVDGHQPADVGAPPVRPGLLPPAGRPRHRSGWPPGWCRRRPARSTSWSRSPRWRCAGSCAPTRSCPSCRSRSPSAGSPRSACTGDKELTRGLARALLAQLVTFHTPDDVLIAVVTAGRAKAEWEWAKWLPHAQHPTMVDGIGQMRMMAGSLAQIEDWLDEELRDRQRFTRNAPPQPDQPHVVIVIDDGEVTREEQIILEEGLVGVTLLDLSDSPGQPDRAPRPAAGGRGGPARRPQRERRRVVRQARTRLDRGRGGGAGPQAVAVPARRGRRRTTATRSRCCPTRRCWSCSASPATR